MNARDNSVTAGNIAVRIQNVWKRYDCGAIAVLNGVDLQISTGQIVALCGPSGCGKSTLLHLVGGLDRPNEGTIEVNGSNLSKRRDMVHFLRHEVGFIFQLHNLIPDLTMEENCLLPAFAAGINRYIARNRLYELAEQTGMQHRLHHRIQRLSGGERQRTAICRALMNRPAILLADEPTGSLDERASGAVFELLVHMARSANTTLLMATHDRNLASSCDRLVEMHDGSIREST
jgi:ABC-type lipoprotein export system ATPase subunit